jgi:hypothetical protein
MKTLTLPLALCWLALPPTLCAQTYLVTDLGLPGELESQAMSLNASGTVAGYSLHSTGMTARAWMWTADGGRVELGGFGGLESRAYACSAVSFTTTPWLSVSLMRTNPGNLLFTWDPLQPVYYRLGDYYTYTLVCNPTLATNAAAWLPAPGFSWPTTNTSVELPATTATNQFYRVKADYLTQP